MKRILQNSRDFFRGTRRELPLVVPITEMTKEYRTQGMDAQAFMNELKRHNPKVKLAEIREAYDFARAAHYGQKRFSGEPYFSHVLEVAFILSELGLDTESIVAGLLHDVLEDTNVKGEDVARIFGEEVFSLVEGVTKINEIDLDAAEEEKAENLRKVILATTKDIRVIIIKIIDRLHNMRTLKYAPKEHQIRTARETLDIYAPIAYKLGMHSIKSELEDLSLRYLEPTVYQELKRRINKTLPEREKEVKRIVEDIQKKLEEKGMKVTVYGRAKHFYSIYKKMKRKNLRFEDVHDLYAIRVIVDTVEDCYRILGLVHALWTPLPKTFDDYIATPKSNLYRSIHTEIIYGGFPLEIQIRTWDMHRSAEDGIAAHWRYKDTERDKEFDRRISWLKQVLDWQRSSQTAQEFIERMKIDLFKDEIFVFTPKGDPIPLPEGATPVDFAYGVHTDIGNHCMSAKVNGTVVSLDTQLKSGDICYIVTSKNGRPSRKWLQTVKTQNAKSKIRQALGIKGHFDLGKKETSLKRPKETKLLDSIVKPAKYSKATLKFGKCCTPKLGEKIQGYRTKDGKVAVHEQNCITLRALDDSRKIELSWRSAKSKSGDFKINVKVTDRVGILPDVLNTIANSGMNIKALRTKTSKSKYDIQFDVHVEDEGQLTGIVNQIKGIQNVLDVKVTGP